MGCCQHQKASLKTTPPFSKNKISISATTSTSLVEIANTLPHSSKGIKEETQNQRVSQQPKVIVKKYHQSGIILNTIVNQMDLDSDEYDQKKSEIADQLVDKYDKGEKGYLDQLQFLTLVKQNSSKPIPEEEIRDMMTYDEQQKKRVIDKLDLFQLIRRPK